MYFKKEELVKYFRTYYVGGGQTNKFEPVCQNGFYGHWMKIGLMVKIKKTFFCNVNFISFIPLVQFSIRKCVKNWSSVSV